MSELVLNLDFEPELVFSNLVRLEGMRDDAMIFTQNCTGEPKGRDLECHLRYLETYFCNVSSCYPNGYRIHRDGSGLSSDTPKAMAVPLIGHLSTLQGLSRQNLPGGTSQVSKGLNAR